MSGCTSKRELGNTLRVAVREKYRSLDPAHGGEYYSDTLIRKAYEGLLEYNYLKRPYVLQPLLAEALPTVSADGLTYTFKIKKGVLFQDDKAFKATNGKGRELTAEDFVYSWKRLADPREMSDGWWTLDHKILGLNEWREQQSRAQKTNYEQAVQGLQAMDRYTLQLKLVKPDPLLVHLLTLEFANAVAREVVEYYGKEIVQHPVGTGPYRLETLTPNQLVWVKNPTWHGQNYPTEGAPGDQEKGLLADAGKPLPFVDRIVNDIIIEDQPAWLNFIQSNHDYMMKIPKDNQTAVFDSNREPKKEIRDKGINVHVNPAMDFTYFGFNMEDSVVGGPKNTFLRKAMSLAFDEGPLIEKFYLGLAKKAESPLPPTVEGYDPNYKNPSRQYNLVAARELLAKAGYPGGQGIPELVIDTTTSTTLRQIGEYFAQQMAQLGIKVRVNPASWAEFMNRIRRKQTQIFAVSWLYDFPDAENGWQILYGPHESPGSNEANYKNPKFDELYRKIAVMRDGPERRKLFDKMKQIFAEDVPWIISVHRMETRLTQSWVRNFKTHHFDHNIDKYLRIDAAARKEALK